MYAKWQEREWEREVEGVRTFVGVFQLLAFQAEKQCQEKCFKKINNTYICTLRE